MSKPRRILPGYVEVCSRTFERRLALLPTSRVKNLLLYVYGHAAEKHSIKLHALCVMGNHVHLLMHDEHCKLPLFMAYANGLIARALNCYLGRDDKFWSADPYGALRPQEPEDLMRRYVYILTNPSAANLVRYNHDYPGIWSGPHWIGRTISAERPDFFFSEDGDMPESVTVTFEVPEVFNEMGVDAFKAEVKRRIATVERDHRRTRKQAGVSVMGRRRLLSANWNDTPKSDEQWFSLDPAIASHDRTIRKSAIRELRRFRDEYRAAWHAWREGDIDVEFPHGSWWMPNFAHARCPAPG